MKNLFGNTHFKEDLTLIADPHFEEKALALFRVQAAQNDLYAKYIHQLGVDVYAVQCLEDIPFLPIRFFKSHELTTGKYNPEAIFESSGTTGTINSKHLIADLNAYLVNAEDNFETFFGPLENYCILALLPSYLERNNSSLVFMADHFIKKCGHPQAGFFLHDHAELHKTLVDLEKTSTPVILIGVTFALIDFAEKYRMQLNHTHILETGGMKGRKKEITRAELHEFLHARLGTEKIGAEYGMTELQSQAYSYNHGVFYTPPTIRVLMRALDDPFEIWNEKNGVAKSGVINVIDLANKDSLAFIATDDLGRYTSDGGFEVLGRVDNCDIRGCSLMV